jgi:hypothetical protein
MKNTLFNENVLRKKEGKEGKPAKRHPNLKRIK